MLTHICAVQLVRLQVEEEALKKEKKEKLSKERLEVVRQELGALRDDLQPLMAKYTSERQRLNEIRDLKQKKEQLLQNLEHARVRGNLERVADIKYGEHRHLSTSVMSPLRTPFFLPL